VKLLADPKLKSVELKQPEIKENSELELWRAWLGHSGPQELKGEGKESPSEKKKICKWRSWKRSGTQVSRV
jgi:hypothetical protein